ncbi:ATP-dependent RNA helicase DDX19A-like [Porites lutea]
MTNADEDWAAEVDEQERQISGEVDKLKLSNTSTTKPTEEKQANTEEEDNELTKGTDLADASFLMKVLRSKLVKTKNEVEVQRNDPSSPLYSVKSFEELPLSEQLRRGVYDMGFNKPSKIQETALPMLLADP